MKPNVVYRLVALSMAALILLSTSGIALNFHYCGGHLASFALWKEAPNCMELMAERNCSDSGDKPTRDASDKKECPRGCCDDRGLEMDADYDIVISAGPPLEPTFQWQDVPAISTVLGTISEIKYHHEPSGLTYRPPPDPGEDIHSRLQTWLL